METVTAEETEVREAAESEWGTPVLRGDVSSGECSAGSGAGSADSTPWLVTPAAGALGPPPAVVVGPEAVDDTSSVITESTPDDCVAPAHADTALLPTTSGRAAPGRALGDATDRTMEGAAAGIAMRREAAAAEARVTRGEEGVPADGGGCGCGGCGGDEGSDGWECAGTGEEAETAGSNGAAGWSGLAAGIGLEASPLGGVSIAAGGHAPAGTVAAAFCACTCGGASPASAAPATGAGTGKSVCAEALARASSVALEARRMVL